jgi:hypothetical protein
MASFWYRKNGRYIRATPLYGLLRRNMKKTIKSIDVKEGRWYRIMKEDFLTCCDCGLVHKVNFKATTDKPVKGKLRLYIKFYREDKKTDRMRRKKKITVEFPDV